MYVYITLWRIYVYDYHHGESSLKCEFHPPFPKVYASKDIDRHYRHGDPADLKLGMFRLHHLLRLEAEQRPPTKHQRNIRRNNRINQKSGEKWKYENDETPKSIFKQNH